MPSFVLASLKDVGLCRLYNGNVRPCRPHGATSEAGCGFTREAGGHLRADEDISGATLLYQDDFGLRIRHE